MEAIVKELTHEFISVENTAFKNFQNLDTHDERTLDTLDGFYPNDVTDIDNPDICDRITTDTLCAQIVSLLSYRTRIFMNNNSFSSSLAYDGIMLNIFPNIACLNVNDTWYKYAAEQVNLLKQETYDFAIEGLMDTLKDKLSSLKNKLTKSAEKNISKMEHSADKLKENTTKFESELSKKNDNDEIKTVNAKVILGYIAAGIALISILTVTITKFGSIVAGGKAAMAFITSKLAAIKWPGKKAAVVVEGTMVKNMTLTAVPVGTTQKVGVLKTVISRIGGFFSQIMKLHDTIGAKLGELFQFKFLQNSLGKMIGKPTAVKTASQLISVNIVGYGGKKAIDKAKDGGFGDKFKSFMATSKLIKVLIVGIVGVAGYIASCMNWSIGMKGIGKVYKLARGTKAAAAIKTAV